MRTARRIANLPPYLFAEIDRRIAEKRAQGVDVISMGIGDPDIPTPAHIVEALCEAARDPVNHRYPDYFGMVQLRQAIAGWYERRFQVELDPDREVLPLIGSKEGIGHIALCLLDARDLVLVPDPGYPVYQVGSLLAGAEVYPLPLRAERGFLPDLNAIPREVAERARAMWLNYPNNPTAALASTDFFSEVVDFARLYDIVVLHDNAYSEVSYDGYHPPSFLQVPGAKETGIEFHSLSKTYNMTGWRIGMAVGNRQVIEALGRVKTNLDSGIFQAIQIAGIRALTGPQDWLAERNAVYQRRRDRLVAVLTGMGLEAQPCKASLYLWVPAPRGYSSMEFAVMLLDEAGVVVTPGVGFGKHGEGYFRISLTTPDDRVERALARLRALHF
ncbi:MAG: LL-diaminopimelate aminotransferase [Chloroflexi bacterium]|nr:LL-diaminopimelate aminotransferase [Chloroflexota bacterium]